MTMTNPVQDVSNKALDAEKGVENKVPQEVTDTVKQGASELTSSEKEKPSTEQERPNNVTSPVASDAKVAAPESAPTAAPSTQEPAIDAGERVTEHTTVYTEATPQVLESENHHVVTESVPITHTSIPDYNERATADCGIGSLLDPPRLEPAALDGLHQDSDSCSYGVRCGAEWRALLPPKLVSSACYVDGGRCAGSKEPRAV